MLCKKRQKDRKTERQKDRKTERQKDRKTERQKDRKTDFKFTSLQWMVTGILGLLGLNAMCHASQESEPGIESALSRYMVEIIALGKHLK
jgi:hypothetical protein